MTIYKEDGKHTVRSKSGALLGTHDTRQKAERQERQIEEHKERAKQRDKKRRIHGPSPED